MRVLAVGVPSSVLGLLASAQVDGCQTEHTSSGEDALGLARHHEFSLAVLNLALPGITGNEVIRNMRTARINLPVLALSSSMRPEPRVAALTAGADDVVPLPVHGAELFARMRALVRRCQGYSHSVLTAGPVAVCLETHDVLVNGISVHLTGKERAILELLVLRKGMSLSKEAFLDHLYGGSPDEPDTKIIDVFICKLRRKLALAGAPDLITTVWGQGYTIRVSHQHASTGARTIVAPERLRAVVS